jgi:hypothetical protein
MTNGACAFAGGGTMETRASRIDEPREGLRCMETKRNRFPWCREEGRETENNGMGVSGECGTSSAPWNIRWRKHRNFILREFSAGPCMELLLRRVLCSGTDGRVMHILREFRAGFAARRQSQGKSDDIYTAPHSQGILWKFAVAKWGNAKAWRRKEERMRARAA